MIDAHLAQAQAQTPSLPATPASPYEVMLEGLRYELDANGNVVSP